MPSMINFQNVTALGTAQAVLLARFFPEYLPQLGQGKLPVICLALVIVLGSNYALLLIYSLFLYPVFISPLRRVPQPKVRELTSNPFPHIHLSINIDKRDLQWFLARLFHSRFIRQEHQGDLFLSIVHDTPNEGILLLREGVQDRLLVTSTPVIAEMLVHKSYDFTKPTNIRNFMQRFLGDGLIIAEGERHRWLRKISQQAFTHRHIKDLYPMMWTKALDLREEMGLEIQKQQKGAPGTGADAALQTGTGRFEISIWANKITFDIIGVAAMGRDSNLLRNDQDPLARAFEDVTGSKMLLYFVMSAWLSFRFVQMLPWDKNRVFNEGCRTMKETCQQLIHKKRDKMAKQGHQDYDILSLLITSRQHTDYELAEQLLTYIVAGHDTASATLTWICYLLAIHPDWQTRLRKEIQNALALQPELITATSTISSSTKDATKDDRLIAATLNSLPSLNGIINETLRLYPTVPVTTRVAACDTMLGTQFIPQGTNILISPWLINRDPLLWGPQAGTFNPERWVDAQGRPNNSGGAKSNYAFMTFLHGPRSCIGREFARAELQCLLAAMVSRFEWALDMEEKAVIPAGAITIKPQNGLYLKVKRVGEE